MVTKSSFTLKLLNKPLLIILVSSIKTYFFCMWHYLNKHNLHNKFLNFLFIHFATQFTEVRDGTLFTSKNQLMAENKLLHGSSL